MSDIARGEFVARFGSPEEMTLAETLYYLTFTVVYWLPVFVSAEPCLILTKSLNFCHIRSRVGDFRRRLTGYMSHQGSRMWF